MIKNLPPSNIEAEHAVISSAIISRDSLEKVIEYGKHIYYLEDSHKAWKILKQLYDMDMEVSLLLFKDIARKEDNLSGEYIDDILTAGSSSVFIDSLLKDIMLRWREREIIRITAIIQEKAYERQDISSEINELVLLGEAGHSEVEVFDIVELADKPLNELVEDRVFIKTGIEGLDFRIHGIEPEQLIIIAAESGMGKTTLSWQIMNSIKDSLFITLEETRENLYIKLLSRISEVDSFKFKGGNFHGSEIERINEAREWIKENIVSQQVIDSDINLLEIISVIKKQHRAGKCRAVAIENVSLISGALGDNKADKYNYISRTLKKLAKELRIPIFLMSQQNKDSYNGEPSMSDLNYLAPNDADYIWFCWDDSLVIAKGRTVKTGRIPDIYFRKEISKFETLKATAF